MGTRRWDGFEFELNKVWPQCIVCGIQRRNQYQSRILSTTISGLLTIQDAFNVFPDAQFSKIFANPIKIEDQYDQRHFQYVQCQLFLEKYCSINCFNQHLKQAKKQSKNQYLSRSSPLHSNNEEYSQADLRQILINEEGRCRVCGDNRVLELHHIIPQEYGGKTTRGNCVLLCPTCHALTRGQGFINQ
jgi:hypothetical protein